jgi:hypothetical protein
MKKPYLSNFEIILENNILASTVTRSLEDSDNDNNFGRTITKSLEDTDNDMYGRTITESLEDTDNDITPTLETIGMTKTASLEDTDTNNYLLDLLGMDIKETSITNHRSQ